MRAQAGVIALAIALSGCWYQEANAPTTSALLAKCRDEGRGAFYDGATADEAEAIYQRCKAREGVQ
jgi:hypothetical protein